jgi:carboxypeptidase family protein
MKSHLPLCALIVFATITLASDVTFACSCGSAPPVLDAYERASAVVIVKVLHVEPFKRDDPETAMKNVTDYGVATFVVEKVYKGKLRVNEQFSFGAYPNAACFMSFRNETAGRKLLLYLSSLDGNDAWFASTCSRSRPLEYTAEDLLYLDNMEKYRGQTRVSGNYRGGLNATLQDIANRTIRIRGEQKTHEIKTDANGVFEIYDLPSGKYVLEFEIPNGWQLARYSVSDQGRSPKSIPFTLEAKKHVNIDLLFEHSNVVSGRVIGPNGNPMKGVCVDLLKPDQVEVNTAFACTDEEGEFRVTSVPEGSYIVVLNADGKLSPEEPFPTIFYPNVSTREKATLITIANGETVKGINFVVSQTAETITLSGVLLFSDGRPVADEDVEFIPLKKDDEEQSETTDSEGRFTIRVLKGAKGEIFGEFYASLGDFEKCPKLDALIKASGEETPAIKTPGLKVDAEHDTENLVLQFPFPKCKKKE